MAGSSKDIKGVELLVLQESSADQKGNWKKVRLVQWVVDGKAVSVKLEKRGFFKTQDGDIRMGKAEGLGLSDMKLLMVKNNEGATAWARVMALMENPPAYQPEPKAEAGAAADEIDSIPF